MSIYNIRHTDTSKPTINVDETKLDQSTDVTFFGRRKLQYGEEMNQNILHLLEHFACPPSAYSIQLRKPAPDLNIAAKDQISGIAFLTNPTNGQLWYNSADKTIYYWNASEIRWRPIGMQDDLAANWGIIFDGQRLPQPVSTNTGRVFQYSECSWIVSPYKFPENLDYMSCTTDTTAHVTSIYSTTGSDTVVSGFANYLIIGLRDNNNLGTIAPVPSPTPTPAITPTPTASKTRTPNATATVTPSRIGPPPTPTPSSTKTYLGPLTAFGQNPLAFAGRFEGQVDDFFPGDGRAIKYPGITDTQYQICFTDASFGGGIGAQTNPWQQASDGFYYITITKNAIAGSVAPVFPSGLGGAPYNSLYNQFIFCSNDGVNGLFYKVTGFALLGANLLKIKIDTSSAVTGSYFNRQPTNSGFLQFSYTKIYLVGADYGQNADSNQSLFYINTPSPYLQNIDLIITGGNPPYAVTAITPPNPVQSKPIVVIGTSATTINGMPPISAANPVLFDNINSISSTFTFTQTQFQNALNSGNPNIVPIPNGYRIKNFLVADINYPANWGALYLGCSNTNRCPCRPEQLWWFSYGTGEGSCGPFTGNGTNGLGSNVNIAVQDASLTSDFGLMQALWEFQTIDVKFPNTLLGFSSSICGRAAGDVIHSPGTISSPSSRYKLKLSVNNDVSSTQPRTRWSQVAYLFSVVAPLNDTDAGNWSYDTVASTPKLSVQSGASGCYTPITGGCSANVTSGIGLLHRADSTTCGGTNTVLTPYNGTTGSIQTVYITKYVDNTGFQRTLSNPIVLRLYPVDHDVPSIPAGCTTSIGSNSFLWQAIQENGTNANTVDNSPNVPYDLVLDVIIPSGVPAAGSIVVKVLAAAYSTGNNCFGFGQGATTQSVTINFDAT